MSSRPKALLKQSKQRHKKEQVLDTADDFQAAGVDFEDAAGKWRAGDAVKSLRFFNRAIETYDQGLQKFPDSFDLAYNKARVQLEIATHPTLVKQLQQSVLTALRSALESHRYALKLSQDNPDILFNTSQVLTSLAEEIANKDAFEDTDAVQYLEEALAMQDRCLSIQELKYEESLEKEQYATDQKSSSLPEADDEVDDDDGGAPIESTKMQEEQWFSIIEPVTLDSLIDTALAQLSSLTTLCTVLSNSPSSVPQAMLAWIEEYSSRILHKRLPFFVKDGNTRLAEIALVKANFVSSLLDAGYRMGRIDAATYKRERDAAFAISELELEAHDDALIANAKSLMSFNVALSESAQVDASLSANTRWSALSAATTNLVTASKLTGMPTENLAQTHMLRGDCSILQYQMGLSPTAYHSAVANAQQLLKNAEVFYRNASRLFTEAKERDIGTFRSGIAQYLQKHDVSRVKVATKGQTDAWVIEQLDDMILEGLLPLGFQLL